MQQVKVAQANVATIQTRIDDATLKSPVTGRVLYRLAEAGEVLAPGGKALTLVNLRRRLHGDLPPVRAGCAREDRRRRADHRRLRAQARGPRKRELRVAGSAVHSQAGRDQERARKADVPRQDSGAQGAGQPVRRAHQDRYPRCRVRQGRRLCGLAGAAAEPRHAPSPKPHKSSDRDSSMVSSAPPEASAGIRWRSGRFHQKRHPPLRQGRSARRHLARYSERHHGRRRRP